LGVFEVLEQVPTARVRIALSRGVFNVFAAFSNPARGVASFNAVLVFVARVIMKLSPLRPVAVACGSIAFSAVTKSVSDANRPPRVVDHDAFRRVTTYE
jgi:hypothetical protein